MIGDPLLLTKKDYTRANAVINQLKNNHIILIGGTSGSSKSELAYCIQKTLFDKKKSSLVISLDDYYQVMPSIREINRKKMGIDSVGIPEIDWSALKRIYDDFNDKKEISFKRTHKFLDAIEHNSINSEEIDYLVFEGLFANYLRKTYNDNYSVFLEGNPAQTLEFRKIRGKEQTEDAFRQKVVNKEFNVVSQLKCHADLTLEFVKG